MKALVVILVAWINANTPYTLNADDVVVNHTNTRGVCLGVLPVTHHMTCIFAPPPIYGAVDDKGDVWMNTALAPVGGEQYISTLLHELVHVGQVTTRNGPRMYRLSNGMFDKFSATEIACREQEAYFYDHMFMRQLKGYDPDKSVYDLNNGPLGISTQLLDYYSRLCSYTQMLDRFYGGPVEPEVYGG